MSNKNETKLPHVDPRVTDPRAAAYQRGATQRRQPQELPKYNEPPAGGPTPPIPLLDSQHIEGQTMAQQAAAQRRAMHAPQQGQASIFEPAAPPIGHPEQMPPPPPPPRAAPANGPLSIQPADLLPMEATQDPAFQQGYGSMYASAQPELARKYGVMRGNQRIPPQMLVKQAPGAPPKGLSPETVEGLKTFEELQKKAGQVAADNGDKEAEEASKASVAGEAAKAGSGLSSKTEIDTMMSALDMDALHERMVRNLIQNDEQRSIIEERLRPLDLSELITHGMISQIVPIQPGVFEPESSRCPRKTTLRSSASSSRRRTRSRSMTATCSTSSL